MFRKVCFFCCFIPLVLAGIGLLVTCIYLRKVANRDGYMGPDYYVTDAKLNRFSMMPNKTLEYDLDLWVVVENQWYLNTRIKWEKLETIPVYENQELGKADLAPFQIVKLDEKEFKRSYKGVKQISGNVDASKVKNTKFVDMVLNIDAKREGDTLWQFKVKNEHKFECKFKVPMKSGGDFEEADCVRKK